MAKKSKTCTMQWTTPVRHTPGGPGDHACTEDPGHKGPHQCSCGAAKELLFAPEDRLKIDDPQARKRVAEITIEMVESMVRKGELDLNDEEALKAAVRRCSMNALMAYNAALEHVS